MARNVVSPEDPVGGCGSREGKTPATEWLCDESGQIVLSQREFLYCLQAESPISQMRHESHNESLLLPVKGQKD